MFYPFSFLSSPFLSFLSFSPFFLFNMAWPTNESHFLAWEALPYATLAKLFLDITIHFITGTDYLFNKEKKPSHHFGLFSDGSCQIYFCGQKIDQKDYTNGLCQRVPLPSALTLIWSNGEERVRKEQGIYYHHFQGTYDCLNPWVEVSTFHV